MTALVRAEVRKLITTRWFLIAAAAVVVFAPVAAVAAVTAAAGQPSSLADLGTTRSIHHILSSSALTSLVMLGVGIAMIGGELRHGTIIPTFLITPRRRDVIVAKLVTVAGIGALMGAIAFGLAVAAAVPALAAHGVHHLAVDTPAMLLGATITGALYGALGLALGAITRSTVTAIVGAVAWAYVVEASLLTAVAPKVEQWLPTGANLAISRTGDYDAMLRLAPAVAVLTAWTVIALVIAVRLTTTRDV